MPRFVFALYFVVMRGLDPRIWRHVRDEMAGSSPAMTVRCRDDVNDWKSASIMRGLDRRIRMWFHAGKLERSNQENGKLENFVGQVKAAEKSREA